MGASAAAGIAAINSLGNLSGFAGPFAMGYLKDLTGSFTAGLLLLAGCSLLGAIVVVLLRIDARREHLSGEGPKRSTLASSWRGIVVSPGGAPTPPGRELTRLTAQAPRKLVDGSLRRQLRDRLAHLRPRIPPAPSIQRHRLTPLGPSKAREG